MVIAQREQWVFGMVDTSQQPALGYMELVTQRDASNLQPIIRAHTSPGNTIHSDEWAAYRRVSNIPGAVAHNTVNQLTLQQEHTHNMLNLIGPG